MKNLTLFFLFVLTTNYAVSQCTSAYSQASYALAHTKKSLSSDNFDHQKYYAGRAIEALEKTKSLVESCGCSEATSPILDALDNLKLAEDPADWEAGRFYAKHGYEYLQTLMTKLDLCTSNAATVNYEVEATTAPTVSATNTSGPSAGDGSLQAQQQELEAEKQRLLEQQRLLEEKIAKQKQLAEQARVNRQLELEEQIKLKHMAEQALFDIEKNYQELARALNCQAAIAVLKGGYSREDDVLNNETLEQTRAYYLNLTAATQQKVLEALKKCTK
ncbi:hypothetical protein [Galbibacter sp. PAP.153]|uniref:hypothetical protein n=1 Tax=Galbibacter sp. PAP.153 TaxID=3104623 RepID=UPI003009B11C